MRWLLMCLLLGFPVASLADKKADAAAIAIEEDETPEDRERGLQEERAQQRETLLQDLQERLWWIHSRCTREDVSRDEFDQAVASLREDCASIPIPVELAELGTSEEQLDGAIRVHEEALTRAANRKLWQQENAARRASEQSDQRVTLVPPSPH